MRVQISVCVLFCSSIAFPPPISTVASGVTVVDLGSSGAVPPP